MVIEVYKRATSADWATARLTSRATTQGARLTDWRTGWHAPLPRVIDPLGAAFLLAFSHEKLTPTTGSENSQQQQQQEQFETRNGLGARGMRHAPWHKAGSVLLACCCCCCCCPQTTLFALPLCAALVVVAAIATLQAVSATSEVPLCRSQCFRFKGIFRVIIKVRASECHECDMPRQLDGVFLPFN